MKPQVDKFGNQPFTVAKLLRAFASGTATPAPQAAVLIVAADMLDPARPAPTIDHRALLKDYMAAVLDYESITFVDKINLSALSDVEHAELKAIQAEVVKERETK